MQLKNLVGVSLKKGVVALILTAAEFVNCMFYWLRLRIVYYCDPQTDISSSAREFVSGTRNKRVVDQTVGQQTHKFATAEKRRERVDLFRPNS